MINITRIATENNFEIDTIDIINGLKEENTHRFLQYFYLAATTTINNKETIKIKYTLNNKCWLGDHQRHRLYDTLGGHFWVYGFDKYISTGAKDGTDEKTDGTLIKSNRIRKGDTITYQMMVTNRSEGEVVLTGASIFDALPQT